MEHPDYRNTLEDILAFSEGKRMLTMADVSRYTGITNYRTLHKRFSFQDAMISAPSLARQMCGGR